jgi:hypothetical protein
VATLTITFGLSKLKKVKIQTGSTARTEGNSNFKSALDCTNDYYGLCLRKELVAPE